MVTEACCTSTASPNCGVSEAKAKPLEGIECTGRSIQ